MPANKSALAGRSTLALWCRNRLFRGTDQNGPFCARNLHLLLCRSVSNCLTWVRVGRFQGQLLVPGEMPKKREGEHHKGSALWRETMGFMGYVVCFLFFFHFLRLCTVLRGVGGWGKICLSIISLKTETHFCFHTGRCAQGHSGTLEWLLVHNNLYNFFKVHVSFFTG